KLSEPRAGQSVIFGTLHGLDDHGAVLLETEQAELASIEFESIQSARILFEWKKGTRAPAKGNAGRKEKAKKSQSPQRSR
ncbi:MAG TPA: hypothetical protein VGI70_06435, partial [Polyangiales bacterium]